MRYLIVKTSAFGDIIHTFPVLSYLKHRFPQSAIDWAAESPFVEALEAHPFVDSVHRLCSKEWRKGKNISELLAFRKKLKSTVYDAVFDLQGNCKSALVTFWANSPIKVGFGRHSVAEWPNLLVTNCRFNRPSSQNIREGYLSLVAAYFNLETAVQDDKVMQDFELESLTTRGDHSQKVKAPLVVRDYGSKDCVKLPSSTAVSRLKVGEESFKLDEKIFLKISPEEEDYVRTLLAPFKMQKKILVCPGSAWPNKQMSQQALIYFLKRVQSLQESVFFILWGNEKEREAAEDIGKSLLNSVLMERLSIPVLQNVMRRLDLVIGMDSLPLHLAATTATSTFSIFGASSGSKYAPLGEGHRFYQGHCPYGKHFEKRCPLLRTCATGACIRSLTGDEVFDAFIEFAKGSMHK